MGTKAFSVTTVLAVPDMPATNQVSSMVKSLRWMRTRPAPLAWPASSSTRTPPVNQLAWNEPEAKGHFPVTT